jgi:hypothetical protein
MSPGVVADEVAGVGDLANELRIGLSAAAYEKEGGADVAAGEQIEQARRPGGVGAVVEGEGEFAGARRSDERGTEELGGGPEGGIGKAGKSYCHGGDHVVFQCDASRAERARGKARTDRAK